MKRRYIGLTDSYRTLKLLLIAGVFILILAGESNALIINPRPDLFGPDDQSQIFSPCTCIAALEWYDGADKKGYDGSTFGFFYWGSDVNNPTNLITIFDSLDSSADGVRDKAKIDFVNGKVWDVDNGWASRTEQSSFTPITGGYIGFFLQTDPDLYSSTLYTVASLNPDDVDAAATFPHLSLTNTYLIGYEIPDSDPTKILGFEIVRGITPVSIPEPQTFTLMGFGLLFIFVFSLSGSYYRYRDRG